MIVELLTKADFDYFKHELYEKINELRNDNIYSPAKKWLRGKEVESLLNISNSHLFSLRSRGYLTFTKIDRTIYYDYEEIMNLMDSEKVISVNKMQL